MNIQDKKIALNMLDEIKKSSKILLHCHPSPDPDSVGSALALKYILQSIGKEVNVISGDDDIPMSFRHFPGCDEILPKSFLDIKEGEYDLFIVADCSLDGICRKIPREEVAKRLEKMGPLGSKLKTINIDHHISNKWQADLSIIDSSYPSACELIYDVREEWAVPLSREMALNIYVGMYTDTGGFIYRGVTDRTFRIVSELVKFAPDFSKIIFNLENSNRRQQLDFLALCLSSIEVFCDGKVAISSCSNEDLIKKGITKDDRGAHTVANYLRSVIGWEIGINMVEEEVGRVKISIRTRDSDRFDLSKLAMAFGGGGHKAAAGANIKMSLPEAKEVLVQKIKEIYNL